MFRQARIKVRGFSFLGNLTKMLGLPLASYLTTFPYWEARNSSGELTIRATANQFHQLLIFLGRDAVCHQKDIQLLLGLFFVIAALGDDALACL